jgi:hypothetical protein
LLLDAGAGLAFFVALVAGTLGLDRGARMAGRDGLQRRLESVQVVAFLTGVALVLWLGLATGLTALDPANQDEADPTELYKTSGLGRAFQSKCFSKSVSICNTSSTVAFFSPASPPSGIATAKLF